MHPHRDQLREFLRWKRGTLTRAAVGLPPRLGARYGLTQDDLAELTGYSVRMVADLEHGRLASPSAGLLTAVAEGLRLSQDETEAFYALTAGAAPTPEEYVTGPHERLDRMMALVYPHPSYVTDVAWRVLGHNEACAEWLADFSAMAEPDQNVAWWMFADPHARHVHPEWEQLSGFFLTRMRAVHARYPDDGPVAELVDRLRAEVPGFDKDWTGRDPEYFDTRAEVRPLRRPGHTDPGQPDDHEWHVLGQMVVLEPWTAGDQRRMVTILLPPDEPPLTPGTRSAEVCAACRRT